jgi:prolyl-tRNA synthetase
VPSEVEAVSQKLLIRAGFIRPIGSGIFSYLPLAKRSLDKIKNILRQEMNMLGGQEILLPVVHPGDLWLDLLYTEELQPPTGRFLANNNHEMVLSTAQIEVLAHIMRSELRSYKQLPQLLYQFQTKWRDTTRSRNELISAREIIMHDGYGINADLQSLDNQYDMLYRAFRKVFQRCDLPVVDAQSAPELSMV